MDNQSNRDEYHTNKKLFIGDYINHYRLLDFIQKKIALAKVRVEELALPENK